MAKIFGYVVFFDKDDCVYPTYFYKESKLCISDAGQNRITFFTTRKEAQEAINITCKYNKYSNVSDYWIRSLVKYAAD